jgi:hypothetical protein
MQQALDRIRSKLELLRHSQARFPIFSYVGGTFPQPYRLGKPLTEDDVSRAERHYGIKLPEDYRRFLVEIGNGASDGLQRFGVLTPENAPPRVEAGGPTLKLTVAYDNLPGRAEYHVREIFDEQGRKIDPFDISFYETMIDCSPSGRNGPDAPARPFPLSEPFHDLAYLDGTWDTAEWEQARPNDGVWCLLQDGCDIQINLVLNGPFRGQVWYYEPCDGGGYTPFAEQASFMESGANDERLKSVRGRVFTFFDWYEHCLNDTLEEFKILPQHHGKRTLKP